MHPFWVQDEDQLRQQTAHGAAEFAARGASIIPGFESCTARILTDGSVVLMVGIQSHGQGLETALSQVAAEELGINPARISVRHSDTESTAFGFGRSPRSPRSRICAWTDCRKGSTHCSSPTLAAPPRSPRRRAPRRRCIAAFAFRIAAITRRGVIGVPLTSVPHAAPDAESAWRRALAMAAGGATAPPSPMPFMPYSVCGVGVCR